MAASEDELIGQMDLSIIDDLLQEPSYISEIARKLRSLNLPVGYDSGDLEEAEVIGNTWGDYSENAALTGVMIALSILSDDRPDRYEVTEYEYDVAEVAEIGQSQKIGSYHDARTEDGPEPTREWNEYSIIHNVNGNEGSLGSILDREGYNELGSRIRESVDTSVTVEDKLRVVEKLSRVGNEMSMIAEEVMQDEMLRQFREYRSKQVLDYNDPGADFMVVDEDQRNYGLIVEISTRWVNPIGESYINNKLMLALDLEEQSDDDMAWDVVILAPKFTQSALQRYESPDDPDWHKQPESGMVHLHRVPSLKPDVYKPFANDPDDIEDEEYGNGGNPVIVPDGEKLREMARNTGHLGDSYPVVDDDYDEFIDVLGSVFRDFVIIPESRYRNMIREAVEPLLWEFMRPYKIEQFLISNYWDRGLSQNDIGRLVNRTGGTIGRWMREWGVMRRGTGAPELSGEVVEIWRKMYEGQDPFPERFSGYRIQAEYSRHPLWSLEDWEEWYQYTDEGDRREVTGMQNSFRNNLDYTVMVGATDRLQPSYNFIISVLRDAGVEIRDPDETPRTEYSAYPSRDALEYMVNRNQDTEIDVSGDVNES